MSEQKPLSVVIVGSGPSGFYAADHLLKQSDVQVRVDMLDRLPTPFGLVRGGVAPDHQKIKNVVKVYERTAANPAFRFFGNVGLGTDITVEDLKNNYDAVIYAVGNESDRSMGIPGEDLKGSYSATQFVGWYNGHPNHRDHDFDLSCERAVVVGIGNVAVDVARILSQDVDVLAKTDIAQHAVDALRKSSIKEVIMLGRRGSAQAAYSPAEIKELGEMTGADLVVLKDDAELDAESQKDYDASTDLNLKKNVDYLLEVSKKGEGSAPKKLRLRLCTSPVELIGTDGKVTAVKIEKNELFRDDKGGVRPRGTGTYETIEAGLVLRSVGYRGIPIPGVPFHDKWGIIPNEKGKVQDGEYVVGWAKRGPSGLIGTNRPCSVETAQCLLEEFKGKSGDAGKTAEAAEAMLRGKKPGLITFADWKKLDALEVEAGQAKGKIREKFTRVDEMLTAIKTAGAAA